MKTIELNEELNKFEWGYAEKEKNIANADKFLHYKTLSPEKFIEKNVEYVGIMLILKQHG